MKWLSVYSALKKSCARESPTFPASVTAIESVKRREKAREERGRERGREKGKEGKNERR